MAAVLTRKQLGDADPIVKLNRTLLANHGIVAVSVAGGASSGKTSLLEATIDGLRPEVRIGVITCDAGTYHDRDRKMKCDNQVVHVDRDCPTMPDSVQIYDALQCLDLNRLDLLFIKSGAATADCSLPDLGQDASVVLLSADGGLDQIERQSEIVRSADVVILSKADLFETADCARNPAAFQTGVRHLNDRAELFELSALKGSGMIHWLNWLQSNIRKCPSTVSHWFG